MSAYGEPEELDAIPNPPYEYDVPNSQIKAEHESKQYGYINGVLDENYPPIKERLINQFNDVTSLGSNVVVQCKNINIYLKDENGEYVLENGQKVQVFNCNMIEKVELKYFCAGNNA